MRNFDPLSISSRQTTFIVGRQKWTALQGSGVRANVHVVSFEPIGRSVSHNATRHDRISMLRWARLGGWDGLRVGRKARQARSALESRHRAGGDTCYGRNSDGDRVCRDEVLSASALAHQRAFALILSNIPSRTCRASLPAQKVRAAVSWKHRRRLYRSEIGASRSQPRGRPPLFSSGRKLTDRMHSPLQKMHH